jgi:hypothetical protein
MPLSNQHEQAIREFIGAVRGVFPAGAEIEGEPKRGLNLHVTRRLHGQPEHLTQYAKPVSIRFGKDALDEYMGANAEGKAPALRAFEYAVRVRMNQYDEGRATLRGADNPVFIIEAGGSMREAL